MKDDSGSFAVFSGQGSSVSRMTAVEVMAKDHQDAQYKQTQDQLATKSRWKMHQRNSNFHTQNVGMIWIRPSKHKWTKSCSSIEDQVVLLERNQSCHLLAGLLWER